MGCVEKITYRFVLRLYLWGSSFRNERSNVLGLKAFRKRHLHDLVVTEKPIQKGFHFLLCLGSSQIQQHHTRFHSAEGHSLIVSDEILVGGGEICASESTYGVEENAVENPRELWLREPARRAERTAARPCCRFHILPLLGTRFYFIVSITDLAKK